MKGVGLMKFEPIHYKERLRVINLQADVGVVTLWSKVDSALKILEELGIDLDPDHSRIAVVANLYGNGLPQMLRNLLWNPQIRHLVILGKNLSGSREWLTNFFEHGLEEVEFLGAPTMRICNTQKTIDGEVLPEHFSQKLNLVTLGDDISGEDTKTCLKKFFDDLLPAETSEVDRVTPPDVPSPTVTRFPSEPRSHSFVRRTPMEAWSELIFRLNRFGYRNNVAKRSGKEVRIELQNVKIVVSDPQIETEQCLIDHGFSLAHFKEYQKQILDPHKPDDLGYTYGNRLRQYFEYEGSPVDSLEVVSQRLSREPDSRHAYISLWDNRRDLPEGTGCPCFVSACFRRFDGKLTLTATFRTQNAMDAWPENLYGLIAIQAFVAKKSGITPGPITVISHSISIDLTSLEKAQAIARNKKTDQELDESSGKYSPRMDPNGEFTVTVDTSSQELVVEHSLNGMKLGEYRGKGAEDIEAQLARDVALSEISHALYLGRELARAEMRLKSA